MKNKYTTKRIEEMRKLMIETIPGKISNGITMNEYREARIGLNLSIIQAIFGCEFPDPKKIKPGKSGKVKFNHRRADVDDLAIIVHMLNDYISDVENPFLLQNAPGEAIVVSDEDMSIPGKHHAGYTPPALPNLEKVNNKKIYSYIYGNDDGKDGVSNLLLTGMDIYDLAAVAKKINHVKTRNAMLLVGGVALVIGGTAAVVYVSKKKAKDDKDDANNNGIPDVDISDIDVDIDGTDVDVDMSDVPNVELNI